MWRRSCVTSDDIPIRKTPRNPPSTSSTPGWTGLGPTGIMWRDNPAWDACVRGITALVDIVIMWTGFGPKVDLDGSLYNLEQYLLPSVRGMRCKS